MALRETLAYEKAKTIDRNVGPREEFFFFPTKDDAAMARKLLKLFPKHRLVRRVAHREAMSEKQLDHVRDMSKVHLK